MCHIPVMKNEILENLNIINNGIYIDGTFGNGGHSIAILNKLSKNSRLFVSDKDINSILKAKKIVDDRLFINHFSFIKYKNYLEKIKLIGKINGIIIDLGLSSCQIFDNSRGFSFKSNGILDMRMDITKGIPAFEWLKNASIDEIIYVFNKFGNEYKYSKKIASEIFKINRTKKIITKTNELVNIIFKIHKKRKKINQSTKYLQAIRIYINNEIEELKIFLSDVFDILSNKGRLLIISFNSLENKIIKNFFKFDEYNIKYIPLKFKEEQNMYRKNNNFFIKKIKKIKPSLKEIKLNNRSRSSILTIFEKNIKL